MSDLTCTNCGEYVGSPIADRIKELEAELNLMKTSGIVEVSVRNPSVMEYIKHWEGRAETAEAKLAKAVEALEYYAAPPPPPDVDDSLLARAALAELKGETDD